jgi:hypothetical protein
MTLYFFLIEYSCDRDIPSIPMLSKRLISSSLCCISSKERKKEGISFLFLDYILINLHHSYCIRSNRKKFFFFLQFFFSNNFAQHPSRLRPCLDRILSIHQQYPVVVYYYDYDYYYSNLSCVVYMYKQTTRLMTIRRAVCRRKER